MVVMMMMMITSKKTGHQTAAPAAKADPHAGRGFRKNVISRHEGWFGPPVALRVRETGRSRRQTA
eukprot:3309277-Karenia_brevis.AAC.1